MHNKLICFDFDGTLFNTPGPNDGKRVWLEKTDTVWPYNGWWGKSESLNTEVFQIPVNGWVFEKYKEAIADPNAYVILATGRLKKVVGMREHIDELLSSNGIIFDEIYLNWGGDTFNFKTKLFEQLMHKLKVDELTMYDDRHEHLVKFRGWAIEQSKKVTIVDVVNKKTFVNK